MFKQKTAYEMRISDWSSVVCSSDLDRRGLRQGDRRLPPHRRRGVGPRPLPRPAQPEGESRRRRIDRTLRSPPLWSAKAPICLTSASNSPPKNNPSFKLCRSRQRSEECRAGKEGVIPWISSRSTYSKKIKKEKIE